MIKAGFENDRIRGLKKGEYIMMNDNDFRESRGTLDQLFKEVSEEEGTLSGGKKLGKAGKAVQSLKETRIDLGSPKNNLIQLTEKLFNDIGIEMSPIHREQMKSQFDFYYMTMAVSLQTAPGARFSRLESKIVFGPKGENEPIVQTIFPRSEWKPMLDAGVDFSLGLDGNLEWKTGITESDSVKLPCSVIGKIVNKNEMKAFVAIPGYRYQLGKTEVSAIGEGNSECFWRIDKPEILQTQTVQFGVVFKVPKQITSIELSGLVCAEPDFQWLTANLRDVFEYLSDNLKNIFRLKDNDRVGKDRLPICDCEKWSIDLPACP